MIVMKSQLSENYRFEKEKTLFGSLVPLNCLGESSMEGGRPGSFVRMGHDHGGGFKSDKDIVMTMDFGIHRLISSPDFIPYDLSVSSLSWLPTIAVPFDSSDDKPSCGLGRSETRHMDTLGKASVFAHRQ